MDNNLFDKTETIPLYDRVKITIYESFQSLQRQNSIVQTAQNSSERKASLINYQERYCRFMSNMDEDLKMLKNDQKIRYMKYYDLNLNKINVINARNLTNFARLIIKNMGITKIENNKSSKF